MPCFYLKETVCIASGVCAVAVHREVPPDLKIFFILSETHTFVKPENREPDAYSRATPVRRAASATAFATAGPTRGSKALGII